MSPMLFVKKLLFRYRRKKFLSLKSNVEIKLRYLLENYDYSFSLNFEKVDSHKYSMYSKNVERLIESMIQMNRDVAASTVHKVTPVTKRKPISGILYFTDDSKIGLRFNKEDTSHHFNRELSTYINGLKKHVDDPIEIQFYSRRHHQQLEDIIELLKHNL